MPVHSLQEQYALAPILVGVVEIQHVGIVLRQLREAAHYTQLEWASKTKGTPRINAQTISQLERGRTKQPKLPTIARLVEVMDVPLSTFFADVERLQNPSLYLGGPSAKNVVEERAPDAAPLPPPPPPFAITEVDLTRTLRSISAVLGREGVLSLIQRLVEASEQTPKTRARKSRRRKNPRTDR